MFAIIESGGKQYRVQEGEEVAVDLLEQEGAIQFKQVLFVEDSNQAAHVGAPYLDKWVVQGEVLGLYKSPKVINFKYRNRKNSRRTVGHRQKYSRVKITKIAKG